MSRIGKKPIPVPSGVKVTINGASVVVEGKAKLSWELPELVKAEVVGNEVIVSRDDDSRRSSAMQGLARSLINNMVVGVSQGFKKELAVIGVGYKVQVTGKKLVLNLGYSHAIEYDIPAGLTITVAEGNKIIVEGADKQMVGQAAATIRSYRKPEPYKGKGIRYVDEQITLKEGKTVG
ncbi:MAG: 50S ribosomal protein L6 [Lentisphaeria bacterium]|nr:50S ribosomal protein L6 [Lentisphaeria bacterium]